ncbi:unnamed protein product [Lactuca saligna]|uniref:Small EDRK-rich factor-like N-terminal domain-containing protein n=1 Tax=Lactuca saligna TaxID=75948 RepID=A0AA35V0U3_LACSI|nr:unnamed protein product [Lactuca saligna]
MRKRSTTLLIQPSSLDFLFNTKQNSDRDFLIDDDSYPFKGEKDRERANARNGGKGKTKDDGLTPEQRRERDAKALQEKAAKKAAQAAGSGGDAGAVLLLRPCGALREAKARMDPAPRNTTPTVRDRRASNLGTKGVCRR